MNDLFGGSVELYWSSFIRRSGKSLEKIFLVSYYWHPFNTAGSFRWIHLSKYLDIHTVITSKKPHKGFVDDIRRVNKIRNIFAHCLPGSLTGGLHYYNQNRGTHEVRELEDFYKEFSEKSRKVYEELQRLFRELVGKPEEATKKS